MNNIFGSKLHLRYNLFLSKINYFIFKKQNDKLKHKKYDYNDKFKEGFINGKQFTFMPNKSREEFKINAIKKGKKIQNKSVKNKKKNKRYQ